ncbi:hypothetical protein [Nostoc sp.]
MFNKLAIGEIGGIGDLGHGYSPVPLFLSLSLQEEYNNGRFMYIGS